MEEKILKEFRSNEGRHVSGEELSRKLGMTRAGIWKHIENLRELGYDISAQPHLGYLLVSSPDRLIPEEIRAGLSTRLLGKRIYSYKSLDSTNDTAYGLAENGEAEGAVIIAERQSKGKGRMRRKWVSPPGGIYMSFILRPEIEPKSVAKITLASAVAVTHAIRGRTGQEALIKWPNDILIKGKKVCGILTEMKAQQDNVDFLIVGIGLNIEASSKALPDGAVSLSDEAGAKVTKVDMACAVIESLEKQYTLFKKKGFEPIHQEWRDLSATLGKRVKISCHKRRLEGQAMDIDDDGALVIRLDNGFMERVFSGDVVLAH